MFVREVFFFILLKLATVDTFSCDSRTCGACAQSSVFSYKCRWCNRDAECHLPASLLNDCKRAENVVEKSHCDDKFSRYEPELSMKMLLLSAAAYDLHDPQECMSNSLPFAEFQLVNFITRECDSSGNKCSAFAAVSHPLKAIVVAFRGSLDTDQAFKVFLETLKNPKEKFLSGLDGEVQSYWKRAFEKLWTCMKDDVKALITDNPTFQVWVTGHSLGGAIASLASTWLSFYKIVSRKNLILYTFGMPRVGNFDYAYQHDLLVNNSWRVVNYDDACPHFPTLVGATVITNNNPYHHGVEAYYKVKATSQNSSHKECHGKPYNEDKLCSFTTVPNVLDFTNHKVYFSIGVGTFWFESRCLRSKRKKKDQTKFFPRFLFKSSCSKYLYRNGSYTLVVRGKSLRIASSKVIVILHLILSVIFL